MTVHKQIVFKYSFLQNSDGLTRIYLCIVWVLHLLRHRYNPSDYGTKQNNGWNDEKYIYGICSKSVCWWI